MLNEIKYSLMYLTYYSRKRKLPTALKPSVYPTQSHPLFSIYVDKYYPQYCFSYKSFIYK